MIGGRLARATFEPDLAMTDGEARLIANDEAFEWPSGKVVEHFNPYRQMFGVGVERPAPRDDGRHPDRPVRQPELRRHRRLPAARRCSSSATAARPATRSTTPRRTGCPTTPPTVLVRARRHRVRHRLRPGRGARPAGRPLPRDPLRGHQPRRARLRDARPPHAAALGAPRASPSTRCRPPPASSSSSPTTCPPSRLPTPDELELIDTVIDPAGARFTRGPRPEATDSSACRTPASGVQRIRTVVGVGRLDGSTQAPAVVVPPLPATLDLVPLRARRAGRRVPPLRATSATRLVLGLQLVGDQQVAARAWDASRFSLARGDRRHRRLAHHDPLLRVLVPVLPSPVELVPLGTGHGRLTRAWRSDRGRRPARLGSSPACAAIRALTELPYVSSKSDMHAA